MMKTILISIVFLFTYSSCKCQKLDSIEIKSLMQGRWVDSLEGDLSIYAYEYMEVSGDSIFFDFEAKQTVELLPEPYGRHKYYYQITKIGCFHYGFPTKVDGTSYFFRVKYQPSLNYHIGYPFSEQSDECYYLKMVDATQLILETDGGGREKTYKKVK